MPTGQYIRTIEMKRKISNGLKGNKCRLGKSCSEETKNKIRQKNKGMNVGEKNPSWKGGVTPEHMRIRKSAEMNEWRIQVFGRDNFTCQNCGVRGVYLEAHHIKSFAKYPELRFEISNGITYCKKCHAELDKNRGRPRSIQS